MIEKIKKSSLIKAIIIVVIFIGLVFLGIKLYSNYLIKFYETETNKIISSAKEYVRLNPVNEDIDIFPKLDKHKKVTDGVVFVNEYNEVAAAIIYDDISCYIKLYNYDELINYSNVEYCKSYLNVHILQYEKNNEESKNDNDKVNDNKNDNDETSDNINNEPSNEQNKPSNKPDYTQEPIIIIDGKTDVVAGIEFTTYIDRINVKIPMITSLKQGAVNLNKKIAGEVLKDTYNYIDGYNSNFISENETVDTTYKFEIKNDVIAIYVTTIGYRSGFPGSGDGNCEYNYFYDIKNDKELSISQALPLMGYTIADLTEFNIDSFKQLDTDGISYYRIFDGKSEIVFHDCRGGEGCTM